MGSWTELTDYEVSNKKSTRSTDQARYNCISSILVYISILRLMKINRKKMFGTKRHLLRDLTRSFIWDFSFRKESELKRLFSATIWKPTISKMLPSAYAYESLPFILFNPRLCCLIHNRWVFSMMWRLATSTTYFRFPDDS